MVNESLQEWRHVASDRLRIDIVAIAKRGENLIDPARLGEHLPNLGRHGIEVEIATESAQTQKHPAAVEVGCDRVSVVLNKECFRS